MDMRLEVVVVPVSDVDRAKQFYKALGRREDADFVADENFRIVQLTPPGSGDTERQTYSSFLSFDDPDGNGWIVQEITTRLPGRE